MYTYKTTPYKHQRATVTDFLSSKTVAAIDADPGTGKTKMTIDIAVNLHLAGKVDLVVVVAPNNVHTQWIDEQLPIHHATEYSAFSYVAGEWAKKSYQATLKQFIQSPGLKWLSINFETFASATGRQRIQDIVKKLHTGKTLCVVDEAHRIKGQTETTKWVTALGKIAQYRLKLTGTPVGNSPFDLFTQYEYLRPGFWGKNYFVFQHHYGLFVKRTGNGRTFNALCEKKDFDHIHRLASKGHSIEAIAYLVRTSESVVQYVLKNPDIHQPYKNLDELRNKIAPITYTIKKEDCMDLPEKVFEPIYTHLTTEQKTAYKSLIKTYTAELEGRELILDNKLTLTLRLQQITGGFFPHDEDETPVAFAKNPKLDTLLESLEGTNLSKIIISAVFTAEVQGIIEALQKKFPNTKVGRYDGKVSNKEKAETKDAYINGDLDILVGHPLSMGTGLNLQRGSLMYIYSNNFSLTQRVQLEDRIHRIGMQGTAVYRDIYIKGTVDERISKLLIDRKEIADFFRNGGNID